MEQSSEQNNENRASVFISYHKNSSFDVVLKIAEKLEEMGIKCWYAPRDEKSTYAGSIVKEIKDCPVFLIVLNREATFSEDVLNEINVAVEEVKKNKEIIIPFKISDISYEEMSNDAIYYILRWHWIDAVEPPIEMRIEELARRVCSELEIKPEKTIFINEKSAYAESGYIKKRYRLIGAEVYPDRESLGREDIINEIYEKISGGVNKLFLTGMGGIGKSEIAKMYCLKYREKYDVIVWMTYDGSIQKTINNDTNLLIEGMQRTDYPNDTERQYFERKLNNLKAISDKKVLIVLDNFDVTGDRDLESFCKGSYSVLFTTRCREIERSIPEIEISAIKDENTLMQLFSIGYKKELDDEAEKSVKKIIKYLNGHTLSIRLLSSNMQKNRISPSKALELLKAGEAKVNNKKITRAEVVFEKLKGILRLSELSGKELYILKNLSLLPLGGIEAEQFYSWCELETYDDMDRLEHKSWIIRNIAEDEIHLHPLVAELMEDEIKKDPDCCEKLINNMYKFCRRRKQSSAKVKQKMLDYSETLNDRLPDGHRLRKTVFHIKAVSLMDMSLYRESSVYFRRVLNLSDDIVERTYFFCKISHVLILAGDYKEALEAVKEGWETVKNIPVDELSFDLGCYWQELILRFAEIYRNVGEYDKAVSYYDGLTELGDRFYEGSPQSKNGWLLYHYSYSLFLRNNPGDLENALNKINRAVSLFGEIDDEWGKGYCYDVKGQILMLMGEYDLALDFNSMTQKLLMPVMGSEHIDIAKSISLRGNIYKAMGDMDKAKECYLRAAEIFHNKNCPELEKEALSKTES
ncbi:MAG: NB-ARC domain-containing protein [Clostridiales bacterium]|nr:NB-ARC domain-containing protein [Clostridiales bacterium]